jgi:hypothetical protein
MDVDKQITDAFGVLAVLLTFVFAFLTILVALTEALLGAKLPEIEVDKERVKPQALVYSILFAVVGIVAVLVGLVTVPLVVTVLGQTGWLPWQAGYTVARGGLVLTNVCLLGTVAAAIIDLRRLLEHRSSF